MERAAPTTELIEVHAMRRTAQNATWLLSSKGVGGLLSLVYLALAARTLGIGGFGSFALILAYSQGVAQLAQFQSWQVVIRYGATHLASGRHDRLHRLIAFSSTLDIASAVAGAAVAAGGVAVVGPALGWSAAEQQSAALFGIALLLSLRATPTGVLRLLDRFALAAIAETAMPLMRLLGAVVAWQTGAGVAGFLVAWTLAEALTSIVLWVGAMHALRPYRAGIGRWPSLRGVARENPDIWRFAWLTHLSMSIAAVWQQAGTLMVGASSGATAAGGFRLAFQIAQALTKPAASLARAIYPELARLAATGASPLGRIVGRSTRLAAIGAGAMVLAMTAVGKPLLMTIGGAEFGFAYPLLLLLAIASAIDLAGFALEPKLLATGRAGAALTARSVAVGVYLLCLPLLIVAFDVTGAAAATIIGAALAFGLMAVAARRNQAPEPSSLP